jgi:exopolysaccharide biosynthesis polyprenyl glycosylphosphotransferase
MISQRIRGLNSLFVLTQLSLVLLVYWLTFWLHIQFGPAATSVKRYELYCIVIYLALLVEAFRRLNKDTNFLQKSKLKNHRIALEQTLWVAAVVIAFVVATKDQNISRRFLFTFLPVLYLTLFLSSCYLPRGLALLTFRGVRQERTLLLGPSAKIAALSGWLHRKSDLGIHTVGVVCDEEGTGGTVQGLRVLGTTDDLERVIRDFDITQVIVVELPLFPHEVQSVANICEQLGVRLLVLSDLESKFRRPITYFDDDGLIFIGLREEPLENPFNRFLKRTMDICVSLPVILFILPFTTLLVALCQLLQSRGPVFLLQPRAGLQNRRFRILKYRTMHVTNHDPAAQARPNDERVYPAGRLFRKFSIDELPQFWNVLKGEMSVVGPRPHLVEHNQEFATIMQNYHVRAFVKPGITGLAQVRGYRGETRTNDQLVRRIQLDIYYLENWSLTLDCMIMLQTAWQIIRPPKTAY